MVGSQFFSNNHDGDGNRTSRSVSNPFDRDNAVQSALNRELAHLLIPQSGSGKDKGLPWPGPAGRMDDKLAGILRGSGVPPGPSNKGVMGGRGSVSDEVYGPNEEYIYDFNAGVPQLLAEKDNGNLTDYLYDGRLYEGLISAGGSYGDEQDSSVNAGAYGQPSDMDGTGSVNGSVYGGGPGSRLPGFDPGNQGYPGGLWANPGTIPGGRTFYQQDGLGSVDTLTNMNGRMLERYSYDAFGQPRLEGERIPNPFMFTGEPYDQADGLLYLRARYYDPQIGRFLSQDTFFGGLTDPLSQNLYVYVENNPLLNVDPTGHGNIAGWLLGSGNESVIPADWSLGLGRTAEGIRVHNAFSAMAPAIIRQIDPDAVTIRNRSISNIIKQLLQNNISENLPSWIKSLLRPDLTVQWSSGIREVYELKPISNYGSIVALGQVQNYATLLNAQVGTKALSEFNDQQITTASFEISPNGDGGLVEVTRDYRLIANETNPGVIYYEFINEQQTQSSPYSQALPVPRPGIAPEPEPLPIEI